MSAVVTISDDHIYTADGVVVPGVTTALRDAGYIDTWWFEEEPCLRGTRVHVATAYHDEGVLDIKSVWPEDMGYFKAYLKFLKDTGFTVLEIEKLVYSEEWGFAGMLDRIGTLFGQTVILDIKTGKKAPWWCLQLAGYAIASKPEYPSLVRYSLELRSDGTYALSDAYTDPYDFEIFKHIMTVHKHKLMLGIK